MAKAEVNGLKSEQNAIEARVRSICAGYSGVISAEVEALARSVVRMAFALNREGKKLETEPLVIEYDNGGGQSGIRENPMYKRYEALNRQYINAINTLNGILGDSAPTVDANSFAEFMSA